MIQIQMGGVQYADNYLVDKVQGSPKSSNSTVVVDARCVYI